MGIPAFFRQIIEKYPTTHSHTLKEQVDYFFIDFNSIIYDSYYALDRSKIYATTTQFEKFLIEEVLKKLTYLVVDVVKPQQMLYIAIDGSAPRAKMVQQRWRRYKSAKDKLYFQQLREKHGMEKEHIIWDASSNISPGTKFMKKLATALKSSIKMGHFSTHTASPLKIVLSDSNVAGEGEHKFLPVIRNLVANHKEDIIVIYSPDADMIVLAMATHKDKIYIFRRVKATDDATSVEKQYTLAGKEYLYLSIDEYRRAFIETLAITDKKRDPIRLITDYVFMTFFGGNDFVMAFPYLKIKEEKREQQKSGLGLLLAIYSKILGNSNEYLILINKDNYLVNNDFLRQIFEELSRSEDYYMRGFQMKIKQTMEGRGDEFKVEREKGKTPFEIDKLRYEHYEYYSQLHPFYNQYKDLFRKIDYSLPKQEWKTKYYEHFFYISPKNMSEYNQYRNRVCLNYLESLIFNLRYYMMGLPSYTFYYQFRAPPVASDVFFNLQRNVSDVNKITFPMGEPYKPFDQLMMILPRSMGELLPKAYRGLMNAELLDYYPIDFEMDVYLGGKHIYSEPILPYLDDRRILVETAKLENTLTDDERERNIVSNDLFVIETVEKVKRIIKKKTTGKK